MTSNDPGTIPKLNRRHFSITAGAAAAASIVGTQSLPAFASNASPEASPQASPAASPAASPVAIATPDPDAPFKVVSPKREEALAKATSMVTFDAPANKGGDLIEVATGDIATLNPVLR